MGQSPHPKFAIGTRCRWIPQPSTDWGVILGQMLLPIEATALEHQHWQWSYLLLLDSNSPSYRWIALDYVREDDLELFPLPVDTTVEQEML